MARPSQAWPPPVVPSCTEALFLSPVLSDWKTSHLPNLSGDSNRWTGSNTCE